MWRFLCWLHVVISICSYATAKVRLLTHGSPPWNKGEQRYKGSYVQGGAHSGAHTSLLILPTGPSSKPGLIGSPAFLIRQKGEKESKSVKTIQVILKASKASPNYKEKVKTQATPKARFVFVKFCNFMLSVFICHHQKGEIVEATWPRSLYVLMMTNKPSKHIK